MYKRGGLYWANLEPSHKSEPGKLRPVLIFQSDYLNEVNHPSTIVIPITSKIQPGAYPLRYLISKRGSLKQSSDLIIDQIRAIDNNRFTGSQIGCLNEGELAEVEECVMIALGIEGQL